MDPDLACFERNKWFQELKDKYKVQNNASAFFNTFFMLVKYLINA